MGIRGGSFPESTNERAVERDVEDGYRLSVGDSRGPPGGGLDQLGARPLRGHGPARTASTRRLGGMVRSTSIIGLSNRTAAGKGRFSRNRCWVCPTSVARWVPVRAFPTRKLRHHRRRDGDRDTVDLGADDRGHPAEAMRSVARSRGKWLQQFDSVVCISSCEAWHFSSDLALCDPDQVWPSDYMIHFRCADCASSGRSTHNRSADSQGASTSAAASRGGRRGAAGRVVLLQAGGCAKTSC